MSEPFVGEIRMFAGNFAPRSWAFCDGQLLAVLQNDALFSLLGTIYGGDGQTTFGLPDLRGRVPVHAGQGPGLSSRQLGAKGGSESDTLTVTTAAHGHTLVASAISGNVSQAAGSIPAATGDINSYHDTENPVSNTVMLAESVGASQAHTNLMPYLCIHFIIALFGIYPSRT
ncbi:MAG TPA: tail fiber protein [Gammaproteobacteria bacterium]|nr:tail fiber protein [Gammaproteobacteria bacterium]